MSSTRRHHDTGDGTTELEVLITPSAGEDVQQLEGSHIRCWWECKWQHVSGNQFVGVFE